MPKATHKNSIKYPVYSPSFLFNRCPVFPSVPPSIRPVQSVSPGAPACSSNDISHVTHCIRPSGAVSAIKGRQNRNPLSPLYAPPTQTDRRAAYAGHSACRFHVCDAAQMRHALIKYGHSAVVYHGMAEIKAIFKPRSLHGVHNEAVILRPVHKAHKLAAKGARDIFSRCSSAECRCANSESSSRESHSAFSPFCRSATGFFPCTLPPCSKILRPCPAPAAPHPLSASHSCARSAPAPPGLPDRKHERTTPYRGAPV